MTSGEVWEMRRRPFRGEQGWVSNRGGVRLLPCGETPGPTIYDPGYEPPPPPPPRKPVGERIAERRKELGLPQREVAEKLGTAPAKISRIESGHRSVPQGRVEAFAEVLEVDPEWFAE